MVLGDVSGIIQGQWYGFNIIEVLIAIVANIVNVVVTSPKNERQQSVNRASTECQQSVNRESTIFGLVSQL
jgi:hypothetical protein